MNVTIQSAVLDNWQYAGTAAKLRIFALQTFKSAEGLIVTGAVSPAADWYRELTCTVGSRVDGSGQTIRTLSIPSFELPSTTDSDMPDARYYALFADDAGRALEPWYGFGNFSVPATTPTTWGAIRAFNALPTIPPDTWQSQVLALITATPEAILTFTTDADVAAYRAVVIRTGGAVRHASWSSNSAWRVVGVAIESASNGSPCRVQAFGRLENHSWSWALGAAIYFDDTGALTQDVPTDGFIRAVGFPLTPTQIFLVPYEPAVIPFFLDDPGVSALRLLGAESGDGWIDFQQGSGVPAPEAGFLRLSNNSGQFEVKRGDASSFLITEHVPVYVPVASAPNTGLLADYSQNFGEDSSLADWVVFNGEGKVTAVIENGCLVIAKQGDAGTQFRGFGRNGLPAGDFTMVCELSFQRHNSGGGGQKCYFALFEDLADTSKKGVGIGFYVDLAAAQSATVSCDAFDNSTTGANAFTTQNIALGGGLFTQLLRIKRVGTDYTFYCSSSGREWQVVKTPSIPIGFTPTGFGFWLAAAEAVTCIVPWVHVYDGAAPTQVFGNTLAVRTGV